MKPNIFILILDSFRADKCFGENKTSKTPNLDNIRQKGIYFSQAISSSDQTGTSLASIFTGLFPFRTGLNEFNFKKEISTYFDILKNNGYRTYAIVPNIEFFSNLTDKFDERVLYAYHDKESWLKLENGLGNQITEHLRSNMKEPWTCFVHIMDIRPPFRIPAGFEDDVYGKTNYDKLVSSIDIWLGSFLKEINMEKTLIVLTADHGEYIPVTGEFLSEIPKIQNIITKGTKSVPFLKNIGMKTLLNLRFAAQTYRKEKLKRILSPYEMRSFNSRATLDLYDEIVRIPLLFVGYNVPHDKIVNELVRQVDIFPTILDIVGVNYEKEMDGRTSFPLINGEKQEELSAYIEVGINLAQLLANKNRKMLPKVIGIRTSEYKYYRLLDEKEKNASLFDLKNDPKEENNIAVTNPALVVKMESLLDSIQNSLKNTTEDVSDEEIRKAKEELVKLGYFGSL